MKLTLQLGVVVLYAPTKFRDNLFKFTLYTIIIHKVGGTTCDLGRHAPFLSYPMTLHACALRIFLSRACGHVD